MEGTNFLLPVAPGEGEGGEFLEALLSKPELQAFWAPSAEWVLIFFGCGHVALYY
jgi:hypothetical protein